MKECLNLFNNTMMYAVVINVHALINNSHNTCNKCKNVKIIYIYIYIYIYIKHVHLLVLLLELICVVF